MSKQSVWTRSLWTKGPIAGAVVGLAAAASADVTFFATDGATLYRTGTAGPVSTFALSDDIIGLTTDLNGRIIGVSGSTNGSGRYEAYRLKGAFGPTPTLKLIRDDMLHSYTSMVYVGTQLYGLQLGGAGLAEVDNKFRPDLVGDPFFKEPSGGLAYDAAGDVLYASSGGNNDSLYTIDYSTGASFLVGATGYDVKNSGLEWLDGTLYGSLHDVATLDYIVGSYDLGSGAFNPIITLDNVPLGARTGFVAVPAPASMALLGLAGLIAARRSR